MPARHSQRARDAAHFPLGQRNDASSGQAQPVLSAAHAPFQHLAEVRPLQVCEHCSDDAAQDPSSQRVGDTVGHGHLAVASSRHEPSQHGVPAHAGAAHSACAVAHRRVSPQRTGFVCGQSQSLSEAAHFEFQHRTCVEEHVTHWSSDEAHARVVGHQTAALLGQTSAHRLSRTVQRTGGQCDTFWYLKHGGSVQMLLREFQ